MNFCTVQPSEIPLSLLLEADPSEAMIQSYLPESLCFAAKDNRQHIVAASVVKAISSQQAELLNIAVKPELQAKGIGSKLLKLTLAQLKERGFHRVELGTGTFGYQLTFYQRLGFRVDVVIKDHFINHYAESIYENRIQHKDMLRLSITL